LIDGGEFSVKRIKRTNDLAFRKAFGSIDTKEILIGLINDLLGIKPESLVFENPYSIDDYKELLNGKEISVYRQTIRDISALMETTVFTAELQVLKTSYFAERSIYYPFDRFCKNYNKEDTTQTIEAIKQDKKSDRYASLVPVYALNILGFPLFTKDDDALRVFQLYDPKRKKKFIKDLIQIGFFEYTKKTFETENQKHWRDYFMDLNVSTSAPEYIRKAANIVEYANLAKEEQKVISVLEKNQADYDASIASAFLDGEEHQRKIAQQQLDDQQRRFDEEKHHFNEEKHHFNEELNKVERDKITAAKKLISYNMSNIEISELLNLPIEKVNEITGS
jgi:predicted transposase/invertase (TIGR01784 family)